MEGRIIRVPQEQQDLYASSLAINQSGLKELHRIGPVMFQAQLAALLSQEENESYYEDKAHFVLGSAVDMKLTQEPSKYLERHYISTSEKKPSATLMAILNYVKVKLEESGADFFGLDTYKGLIWEAMDEVVNEEGKKGYYTNLKNEETRLNKVLGDRICHDYWKDILLARGKQVLTSAQNDLVEQIETSLLTHPHTARYFQVREDIYSIYQFPTYFRVFFEEPYSNYVSKGLLDKVDVNFQTRQIEPQDIKTLSGFTYNFNRSAKSRRYDLQGAYYMEGLRQSLEALSELIGHDVRDFDILPMRFIVESTTCPGIPLTFPLSQELVRLGTEGDDKYPGYLQLLRKYIYWDSFNFSIAEAVAETNGELQLGLDFNHYLPI